MHSSGNKPKDDKIVIGITMGDPAGIGPEIIADTLARNAVECNVCLVGHRPTLEAAFAAVDGAPEVALVTAPEVVAGTVAVLPVGDGNAPLTTPGGAGDRAQFEAVERAVDGVLKGGFDALVTGPVAKNAIAKVSPSFTGHTGYLAERAGLSPDDVTMVFASDRLAVGLVSVHVSLRDVPDALTPTRLARTFEHLRQMVLRTRPSTRPRIGVAALNPHAGEDGLFGFEEAELLQPFCREMASKNEAEVVGPLPADTIYREALAGHLDAVVAAYHDQAMIPLKLAGVGQMVNVTMGLPFVRTSPDHGVAYDLARTGRADPSGFRLALKLAVTLSLSRS